MSTSLITEIENLHVSTDTDIDTVANAVATPDATANAVTTPDAAAMAAVAVSAFTFCRYVFRRGKKRGESCGKQCQITKNANKYAPHTNTDFCKDHVNRVMDVQRFPTHIMREIVDQIRDKNVKKEFARLSNLGATCREYREIMLERCEQIYKDLGVPDENDHEMELDQMSFKRRLHLLLESGCQRCDAPRITKIHWPYPMRLCHDCIREITVPDYMLREHYRVFNFTHRRSVTFNTWNRVYGDTQYRCYLIKDVEAGLGKTLDEIADSIDQRSLDHKREIADRLDMTMPELFAAFPRLMQQLFPDEGQVIAEFYKRKAMQRLTELGYNMPHFQAEYHQTYVIRTEAQYETFLERLETNAEMLGQKYARQLHYENQIVFIKSLEEIVARDKYYTTVDLNYICPGAYHRPPNETIAEYKSLEGGMMNLVVNFCLENKADFSYFDGDPIALTLAEQFIKYPAKEPRNAASFAMEYIRRRYRSNKPWIIEYVSNIKTWTQARDFIKTCKVAKPKPIYTTGASGVVAGSTAAGAASDTESDDEDIGSSTTGMSATGTASGSGLGFDTSNL